MSSPRRRTGMSQNAPLARARQDFLAGAYPVSQELVVRTADERHLPMLAVDPRHQRRLDELFAAARTGCRIRCQAEWKLLQVDDQLSDARLDLLFVDPVRLRLHLTFDPATSPTVRYADRARRMCLMTPYAFEHLKEAGFGGQGAIVISAPPAQALADLS